MAAVTIPVMAKARVGHFAEAQILEALGVDMVDESEGNIHMLVVVLCNSVISNSCKNLIQRGFSCLVKIAS